MSTSVFPGSLDSFVNPTAASPRTSPSAAGTATLANDALSALEAKVGVNSSAVTSSLDYKVSQASSAVTYLQEYNNTVYADGGTTNALSITPATALAAYASGQTFMVTPAAANTSAATLNVSGLGTKSIKYRGQDLFASQLSTSLIARLVYDGTNFQLMNPATLEVTAKATSNQTVTSVAPVQLTGLSAPINVPSGSTVEIECYLPTVSNTATSFMNLSIWDGTVGSGTQVQKNELYSSTATGDYFMYAKVTVTGVSGAKTYNAGLNSASGTLVATMAANAPGSITARIR